MIFYSSIGRLSQIFIDKIKLYKIIASFLFIKQTYSYYSKNIN